MFDMSLALIDRFIHLQRDSKNAALNETQFDFLPRVKYRSDKFFFLYWAAFFPQKPFAWPKLARLGLSLGSEGDGR
jgi:hypothetical protein